MIKVPIVNNHLGDMFDPFDITLNSKYEDWWKTNTLNFMHQVYLCKKASQLGHVVIFEPHCFTKPLRNYKNTLVYHIIVGKPQ
jgi:hypothetical protein